MRLSIVFNTTRSNKESNKEVRVFSFRQLEYFVTTVEKGSISSAAKVLEVSPQAISKAINDMERDLGRALFARKSSGLKPTPYGFSLYKKARKMLEEVGEFETYARGYSQEPRSKMELLLCVPKFANFSKVSDRINSFIKKHTDISSHVKRSSLEECIENLAVGNVDAFITIGKTDLPYFDVNVIDTIEVGALMGVTHPYASREKLSIADFEDTPLYLTPSFVFFYNTVLNSLNNAIESSNPPLLRTLDMSIHGLYHALVKAKGCVTMPNIHGIDNWVPDSIVVPFDTNEVPRVPLCLVTDKELKSHYCMALERLLVERPMKGINL